MTGGTVGEGYFDGLLRFFPLTIPAGGSPRGPGRAEHWLQMTIRHDACRRVILINNRTTRGAECIRQEPSGLLSLVS